MPITTVVSDMDLRCFAVFSLRSSWERISPGNYNQPRKSFPVPVPELRASRCLNDCCASAITSSTETKSEELLRLTVIFFSMETGLFFVNTAKLKKNRRGASLTVIIIRQYMLEGSYLLRILPALEECAFTYSGSPL